MEGKEKEIEFKLGMFTSIPVERLSNADFIKPENKMDDSVKAQDAISLVKRFKEEKKQR